MVNGKSDIDGEKIVKHWVETSDDDFKQCLRYINQSPMDGRCFWAIYQLKSC